MIDKEELIRWINNYGDNGNKSIKGAFIRIETSDKEIHSKMW